MSTIRSLEPDDWTAVREIYAQGIATGDANQASMKLHEKNGFRLIGYRENIGKMNGVWRSVNLLERRSRVTGID